MRLLPAVDGGDCLKKICLKPKGIVVQGPFFLHNIFKFLTRVEGGIGGPNTPVSALGSPVNFTPNLSDKNSNYTTRAGLRLLLHERYGPTLVLMIL